jgi:signal transduction histidine kinase
MYDHIINKNSYETGQLNHNILPTQQQWRRLESNRLLLQPKKQLISISFRLIAMAAIFLYAPLEFVVIWVILAFGSNFWIQHLLSAYSILLKSKPYYTTVTMHMVRIERHYRRAWVINCLIWCGLSFLSQIWLPLTARLLCIVILNALMFLSITRNYSDRSLMHRISAIFILFQIIFIWLRIVIHGDDHDEILLGIVYAIYLLLVGYLLWTMGNRLNQMYLERLDSEYAKMQLIETLSQSQQQLRTEQQALVAANRLVQQFYSGAAHDLRQPVYAMQLYTAMLSDDPGQNTHLLPKITQSCIAINDMFNTLFDYQQMHMNDTELVEKDMSIQDTFQSLALHFEPSANDKGLQIRFRPIAGSVRMVPLYLVRILSNLIANAIRYTNQGGVLVSARKTRTGLRFEIWDTGIGIDDSNMHKIFKEFYKVNAGNGMTSTGLINGEDRNEGLGLGLSIVKQLSSRLEHTDILVRSRPGRGSVFTFTMPLDLYKNSI